MATYLGFVVEQYEERGGLDDCVSHGTLRTVGAEVQRLAALTFRDAVRARTVSVEEQARNIRSGYSTSSHFRTDIPLEDTLSPIEVEAKPRWVLLDRARCYVAKVTRRHVYTSQLSVVDLGGWEYRFEWAEFVSMFTNDEEF